MNTAFLALLALLCLPPAAGQAPDYAAYEAQQVRGMAHGQSYQDPITGTLVYKVTDSTYPAVNGETLWCHDYSSGPTMISLPWGANGDCYTLLVFGAKMGGTHWLIDFNRTSGAFSNVRAAPSAGSRDLQFSFSQNPDTPQIAYYIKLGGSTRTTIARYDTAANADAPQGSFPKSLSALCAVDMTWLQQDYADGWFAAMARDNSVCVFWNSGTNIAYAVKTADIAALEGAGSTFDEPHLDYAGGTAYLSTNKVGVGNNMVLLNLSDGSLLDTGILYSHQTGFRGRMAYHDGNNRPTRYDPVTAIAANLFDNLHSTDGDQHPSAQWHQVNADPLQDWLCFDTTGDGEPTVGKYSLDSGSVYKATISLRFQQTAITRIEQSLATDISRVQNVLMPVSSRAAMTEGTFFWNGATKKLYVWAVGGLNLSVAATAKQIRPLSPNAFHEAVGFAKMDGSDLRLLCHYYSTGWRAGASLYYHYPFATVSPDGRLVLFDSDMNGGSNGRVDLFLAVVPSF